MRIKKNFTIQQVGNSFIAVPVGEESKTFHGMITLNETGAFIWKQLADKDCTEEDILQKLSEEYAIEDKELVKTHIHSIVESLRQNNILEEDQ